MLLLHKSKLFHISTGFLGTLLNSVSASCPKTHPPPPPPPPPTTSSSLLLSSPSAQQASLQHENKLNLILQLLSLSYLLGSQTVLRKPTVPLPIQTVSFISSVATALLAQLSPAQPPIFKTLLLLLRVFYSFCLQPYCCSATPSCHTDIFRTARAKTRDVCRYPAVRVESGARQNPDLPPLLPRVSARVPRPAHQQPRQDVF